MSPEERRTIDFPAGWVSSPPIDHYAGTRDRDLFVFACLLEDGSNLFALIYPGGQRFVRTAHRD